MCNFHSCFVSFTVPKLINLGWHLIYQVLHAKKSKRNDSKRITCDGTNIYLSCFVAWHFFNLILSAVCDTYTGLNHFGWCDLQSKNCILSQIWTVWYVHYFRIKYTHANSVHSHMRLDSFATILYRKWFCQINAFESAFIRLNFYSLKRNNTKLERVCIRNPLAESNAQQIK